MEPGDLNTGQGAHYMGETFTGALKREGIRISRDGKGRATDNIIIERLWRSVKYEDVSLKEYESVPALIQELKQHCSCYNHQRPFQSLDGITPAVVWVSMPFSRLLDERFKGVICEKCVWIS